MEGGGGREHGKLSPEQELKEGTCVTRSKCGRAVGGVAIKSLARRSPPPERLDCPRRVPGASRTRGGGEGWGRLAKPSVAAGATRKGQNDEGESGFAVLKPPEVCTQGWRRNAWGQTRKLAGPRRPPRAGPVRSACREDCHGQSQASPAAALSNTQHTGTLYRPTRSGQGCVSPTGAVTTALPPPRDGKYLPSR